MKKSMITIVAILVVVLSLTACLAACSGSQKTDAEYILDKGTLICGITLYEPMNYADEEGEMTGFDTEFAIAVCKELGIEAKFQVIKWNSKEAELNSKYIDCIWNGFTVTAARKENIEFTQSYLTNAQCVVVKTANLANYTSKDYLAGKKGTAEQGSAGETAAKELTVNYTAQSAQMTALTDVLSGNSDFAVVDIVLANQIVGTGSYADLSIATAIPLEGEEYAIGFRKGSDMAAKVNEVIDKLLENGTLQSLAEKYGLTNQLITK